MAAVQDAILEELRRLRARVPQLTGALAADTDGLVLAQDTPGVDPQTVAALTGTTRAYAAQLADETGQGDLRELLVRGVYGYVATYAAGAGAVVTLLAQDRVNVGRLHLEGRRAGARIAELVDTAATATTSATEPTEPTEALTKAPAKPAPARARAARTSRAKPVDTRAAATAPTAARTTTES
ncbi:roadblock/LC7 domain-containing protein [Streptomyces sp. NRRL B-24085]|uniref:roadblock/LC7 domain-containing protein n=1 Tax=Streptomyces sp. NRRL B-24085 TaxID=1709476 RepID=UPI0006B385F1|nr:roadblock/LC7 domain-containing protein [Streptomyces sp. NRRL B-24085]